MHPLWLTLPKGMMYSDVIAPDGKLIELPPSSVIKFTYHSGIAGGGDPRAPQALCDVFIVVYPKWQGRFHWEQKKWFPWPGCEESGTPTSVSLPLHMHQTAVVGLQFRTSATTQEALVSPSFRINIDYPPAQ